MSEKETEFKVGDVVVLKCGGPPMCVYATFEDGGVHVNWTTRDGHPVAETYHAVQLTLVTDGMLAHRTEGPEGDVH